MREIRQQEQKQAIGLMSGTSVDGVDAALVKITGDGLDTKVSVQQFLMYPYPDGLQAEILACSRPGSGSVDSICRLNVILAEVFSSAVFALLDAAGQKPSAIDFIGSHGQTVHHLPDLEECFGYQIRSTLQIGEPSLIAKRTGILTVADFRPADMAVGGQGAPLVPYFDFLLFRSEETSRALLNIGGIANATLLRRGCSIDEVIASDTGPGNMVIDAVCQRLFNLPFDDGGRIASRGALSESLLNWALEHRYFERPLPKTTGREVFGDAFVGRFLEQGRQGLVAADDLVATAAELTVQSIWRSYQRDFATNMPVDEFLVSGGGAHNQYLMQRLDAISGSIDVRPMHHSGISADDKEAVCFAVLANETLCGNLANVPAATGAARRTVLGKICP